MTYLLRSMLLVASLFLVAGCDSDSANGNNGNNSGDNGGDGGNNGGDGGDAGVNGPVQPLQDILSGSVVMPLEDAVSGTPLEGAVGCLDEAVVTDLVDVVDTIGLALQDAAGGDPQAAFEAAAANLQASLLGFGEGTLALLESLAGGPGCRDAGDGDNGDGGDNGGDNGDGGDNGGDNGDGGTEEDVDLTQVAELVTTITGQLDAAFAQIPPEAASAPVVGGLVQLLDDALTDVGTLLTEVGEYDGADSAAAADTLLSNLLDNLLLDVIPVRFAEEQAGQPGAVSDQVSGGINDLTGALAGGLEPVLEGVLGTVLDDAGSPVLDVVENDVLGTILTPLLDAINGGGDGGDGGDASGPTDTPLDVILGPLVDAFSSFGGGDSEGPTDTPLDLVLGPLLGFLPVP